MTVKIVTDSVADLPSQVVKELEITVVPLLVRFGNEIYRDGVDLTAEQFYDKLVSSTVLPETSVPSPGAMAEAYDKLSHETDEIVTIVVSARLSGTYNVALQGIELMQKKCHVEVIDSTWATMAEGFIVMEAARAAEAGANLKEVLEIANNTISRVDFLSTFSTLEYLKKGGRIGKAKSLLGSMLKINPLITLRNGVVEPAGKTHSRAQAIERLYEHATRHDNIKELAIGNVACPADADRLTERLKVKFPEKPFYMTNLTPVIGTHTGPGMLLVATLEND